MSKVIGIVGTRRKNTMADFSKVEKAFLSVYQAGDTICSGGCPRGADRFAEMLSEMYGTKVLWYPAEWSIYGRSAGFIRNSHIAKSSDMLIALVADDRKGGTEDTIKKFVEEHGPQHLIILT